MTAAVLPRAVVEMMAKREHRMHHWMWHEVRSGWNQYPRDVQTKIEELGWRPPRPLMDEVNRPILHNHGGEDFLFMHRQMIADVNEILTQVGDPNYPRIEGWTTLPRPGDTDYPVPPAWFNPPGQSFMPYSRLRRLKSDAFFHKRFAYWEKTYSDPAFLRSVSLGELGVLIELTVHNVMHLRWSSTPGSSLPSPDDPTHGDQTFSPEWDDPRYDFLTETYSSHVNPIFWKLHGWIDDRVENWKLANGVLGNDFWIGTWMGKMPGHDDPAPAQAQGARASVHLAMEAQSVGAQHLTELEAATKEVRRSGVTHVPFAQVPVD